VSEREGSDDLTRTVVRGAGFAGAGYAVTQLIGLVSYVAIARLAPPSTFGTFAAASIVVGFATIFAESGMQAALIQRKDRIEEAAATAVYATLAAGVGLSLLALLCAPLVGLFFRSHEIGVVSAALAAVLFLNSATVVPDAMLQRRFSFVRRVVVDPLNMAAFGLVAGIGLAAGLGVWALVFAMYASGATRVVAAWAFVRWRPQLRLASLAMWRELASYARHVVASELLRQVSNIGNTALVGRALGTAPLAQFRFGQRLATQVATPLVMANAYVLFPAFARIADDEQRFRSAALRAVRLLVAVALPVSLALIPLGPDLAVLLFGEKWRPAGSVLAALSGFTASVGITQIAMEIFKAANRPQLLPRIYGALAVASLTLMAAFLPLGATGVALGLSIAGVVVAAYALYALARLLRWSAKDISRALTPTALAGAGMVGLMLGFEHFAFDAEPSRLLLRALLFLVEAAVAAIAYLSLLAVLSPATLAEVWQLASSSLRGTAYRRS
jgi:O-antigen/teichoic acid export membrane protein